MPYKLDVLIERQVMLEEIIDNYYLPDVSSATTELVRFLDTCDEKKGIILVNVQKMKSMESNLVKFRTAVTPIWKHPSASLVVGYGNKDKVVTNFLANFLSTIFNLPTKIFATETEAVNFIISNNPELAETLPKALKDYHAREA